MGFQAAGAAPLVTGQPCPNPETVATAIRIGNPVSAHLAKEAVAQSEGEFNSVTDEEILAAQYILSSKGGVFAEPASCAPLAGLIKLKKEGRLPRRNHRGDDTDRPTASKTPTRLCRRSAAP